VQVHPSSGIGQTSIHEPLPRFALPCTRRFAFFVIHNKVWVAAIRTPADVIIGFQQALTYLKNHKTA
jgi:hypothetical protein